MAFVIDDNYLAITAIVTVSIFDLLCFFVYLSPSFIVGSLNSGIEIGLAIFDPSCE